MLKKFFINYLIITCNNVGKRIDNLLFRVIKDLTKNKIYSLIRKGNIRVNKKRVLPKYKCQLNDVIRLPLITFKRKKFRKKIFFFTKYILYEDDYLLIINKPYGISVHSGTKISLNIIDIYRCLINYKYLELVHRLDKYTTGILMLSKNREMLLSLHDLLKEHKIYKSYIALVYGKWPNTLTYAKTYLDIARICNKQIITKYKYAITYFKIIKYIKNFTLLRIYPITGRKHQIRRHTSQLGYPILGDNMYGNKKLNLKFLLFTKISRLFLHSYSIKIYHMYLHKYLYIKSDLDIVLYKILHLIQTVSSINYLD